MRENRVVVVLLDLPHGRAAVSSEQVYVHSREQPLGDVGMAQAVDAALMPLLLPFGAQLIRMRANCRL